MNLLTSFLGVPVLWPDTVCIYNLREIKWDPGWCHWFLWMVEFWVRFIFFFNHL